MVNSLQTSLENTSTYAFGKRLFVMDNCPCQTSRVALKALQDVECQVHKTPARSPDLNPIENIFHIVKVKLEEEALRFKITKETFEAFTERVFRALDSLDFKLLDRTIASMPKRIQGIISGKGARTKY